MQPKSKAEALKKALEKSKAVGKSYLKGVTSPVRDVYGAASKIGRSPSGEKALGVTGIGAALEAIGGISSLMAQSDKEADEYRLEMMKRRRAANTFGKLRQLRNQPTGSKDAPLTVGSREMY